MFLNLDLHLSPVPQLLHAWHITIVITIYYYCLSPKIYGIGCSKFILHFVESVVKF